MSEPAFLRLEKVKELHEEGIADFGGTLGVRDEGGLESAVMHPQNVYYYGRGDLFDVAAAAVLRTLAGQ